MRRALPIVLVLLVMLVMPAQAYGGGPMAGTPQEVEALESLRDRKLVRLREQAKAIIENNSRSYAGHYLMGYSLHHSEGDLPRAYYHLQKARELFIERHGPLPREEGPWGWLERILIELEMVNGEMDRYEEQIAILDDYMQLAVHLFGREPSQVTASYAWPLMKLGREQEARQKLRETLAYSDELTRTIYWNTKGALEMETGHPQASYEAFRALVDEIRNNGWSMTATYLRNCGEAAASIGRFDEAERLYLESTGYFDPYSFSNPWWDITALYLAQGRFSEAVDALKKMHRWSFNSQPFLAQQSWAANQQITAETLLLLGFTEDALRVARRFVPRPDRQGGDSVHLDQWRAANLLMFRAVLLAQRRALAERMAWARGTEWWKLLAQRQQLGVEARWVGRQAASMAVSHDRMVRSLRYSYAPGTVIVPNWLRLDLVPLYGAGATEVALQEVYESGPESLILEEPYLSTVDGEAQAALGNRDEAMRLLHRALNALPATEVLLRARIQARLGLIEEEQGNLEVALGAYQQVLESAPVMLRIVDVALPLYVDGDSNATLRKVGKMALRSPRFRYDSRGFVLRLSTNGVALQASLLGPNGSVISRAEVKVEKDLDQSARDLVSEIHRKTFGARVSLSQMDINGLDGSNLSGSTQTDRLKDIFFGPGDNGGPRI